MKLGIAVVYLVRDDSEVLLRLHLDRIRRHTSVPYAIHGTALRLPRPFHHYLDARNIRLHQLSGPTEVLAHIEHSWFLTQLLQRALDDGCSHLATLHVDSFPIADHWAQQLAASLSPQVPVTAVMEPMEGDTMARPNLAGMMALAEFWRESRPSLIPTPELEKTAEWRRFIERHQQGVVHSGVGLGYRLEQTGKTWAPILRTNSRRRHPVLAGVYGDKIFHLGAATRAKHFFTNPVPVSETAAMRLRRGLAATVRRILPASIRRIFRPLRPLGNFYDERPLRTNERIYSEIRRELFVDPDHFLDQTRHDR